MRATKRGGSEPQLYKQVGNIVAASIVKAIAENLTKI